MSFASRRDRAKPLLCESLSAIETHFPQTGTAPRSSRPRGGSNSFVDRRFPKHGCGTEVARETSQERKHESMRHLIAALLLALSPQRMKHLGIGPRLCR